MEHGRPIRIETLGDLVAHDHGMSATCGLSVTMKYLSDDPRDKLQAVLNHDGQGADNDLSVTYRDACAIWFARLTQGERWRLATVLAAYDRGAEADAEQFAAALPPAPRFPVS